MATNEPTYSRDDMDAAYRKGQHQSGGGAWNVLAGVAIIVMVGIMIATYIGYNPFQRPVAPQEAQKLPTQQPRAPVAAPQPAPIVVQNVPAGAAPQSVHIPAPAPVLPSDSAEPDVAPAPIVIVLHANDNHGAPIVTGSGACAVAAKGARRCGK